MIKANELRIGNWINHDWDSDVRPVKVLSITEEGYTFEYGGKKFEESPWSYSCAFPIPLTPEILEKCGFDKGIKTVGDQGIQVSDCKDFYLCGPDACITGHAFSGKIKHFHQLQNLYFALTGTELEVKL